MTYLLQTGMTIENLSALFTSNICSDIIDKKGWEEIF